MVRVKVVVKVGCQGWGSRSGGSRSWSGSRLWSRLGVKVEVKVMGTRSWS